MIYRERLWPHPALYAIAFLEVPLITLLIAPFSLEAGLATSLTLFAVIVLTLVTTSPRIEITSTHLKVGRARIERSYLGQAYAYRDAEAAGQRGPQLDARAFTLFRAFLSPMAKVEIRDESDPTPYWLFCSRHPEAVVAALKN